ncbi:MAG TPA: ornithine cyclodeaminase family protein [Bacillota bacterium]|nr:ornithine cyclodeaminase family protein [Bacillota bacterium]
MFILLLNERLIQEHYLMHDAYQDLQKGIIAMQQGKIINPGRTVIEFEEHEASVLYMPSADTSEERTATKVVTIFPHNPQVHKPTTQGVLLLSDAANGDHIAMMNASYLTRLRTGALSAVGTNKLARKDAHVLGAIGTGGMAFEQVLGVLEVRDITQILLFNRTEEKAHQFKEKLIDFGVDIPMEVVTTSEEIVKDADIINCSTRSNDPVFDGHLLKKGTHINGVGSYLPHMREVDVETLRKASLIVVDDLASVKEEAGEMIYADKHTDWSFDQLYGELSDLEMNDTLIRTSDEEITFFKSVGTAYFDLIIGNGIYNKAVALNIGEQIEI